VSMNVTHVGQLVIMRRLRSAIVLLISCVAGSAVGAENFEQSILPVLKQYCLQCHSTELQEGELDLEQFTNSQVAVGQPKVWEQMLEQLANGEMPPKEEPQLPVELKTQFTTSIREMLDQWALDNAGDPGDVVLRRLSNVEYTYTLRDLTGVASLAPAKEFPVDGAAGEGFTNAGAALVMSPSLLTKYLDAAKSVADHVMLLPDGIRFSPSTSRREWTDELVADIRGFYAQFTVTSDVQIEVGGTGQVPSEGGAIPLAKYLTATLEERDALTAGRKSVADVAGERSLNAKYLGTLWQMLSAAPQQTDGTSLLLDQLRQQWRSAASDDVEKLVAWIGTQQQVLFQYNPIGHIGKDGKSKVWMDIATPVTSRRDFSVQLPEQSGDVSIFLSASDAGDGQDGDFVVWQSPRLVIENGQDILLRDVVGLQQKLEQAQTEALARTADYLAAVAEIKASGENLTEEQLIGIAERHNLEASALKTWASYLGVGPSEPVVVTGHFDNTETYGDYNFIRSWGSGATPIVTANSSDNQVRIPGIARSHGITAHPSPTHFASIGWQSPIDGLVSIEAQLSDAHPECGDGQEWFLQHHTHRRVGNLWKGQFGTGGSAKMEPQQVSIHKGELISFILGPKGNHSCDLTEMNLKITEVHGNKRTWDLAGDVSNDIWAGNPHADLHGNANVWHFCTGEMSAVDREGGAPVSVPADSLLHHWQAESDTAKRTEIAQQIQQLVTGSPPQDANSPDGILYAQLRNLTPRSIESLLAGVTADGRFGKHPLGHETAATDLVVQAPSIVEFKIPASLASGRTLVVGGVLDRQAGLDGSVRLEAGLNRVEPSAITAASPIVVNEDSQSQARVLTALADFRELFPPQLCYERIVPVDEVVTLTLFYRQDDALQRLMLNDAQIATLNRMWDELLYVAEEPLRYEVAFEQIREFATQDRPDLVEVWDPLKPQVIAKANAFRQRLIDTEPAHLAAVVEFAGRAWRRKLLDYERDGLTHFYRQLRSAELSHDNAIRLTLARVLSSPAYLYRSEWVGAGSQPVSDWELATRLSYFLWSSAPDDELRAVVAAGKLHNDEILIAQTRRMLQDSRVRRLATEFGCQWLHIRDLETLNEKSERHFPTFLGLRDAMQEEAVRFLMDMFQADRSVLLLLDADHSFMNAALAEHYGMEVPGADWQRVDGLRAHGRGGMLGFAATLAKQSGASRTSPILRGNWISEVVLGEKLPRPPKDVPILPEEAPEGLTERQLIERHSSDAKCARCHERIDHFGFALEGFDAIGRTRSQDAAGLPIDTLAKLPGGGELNGIDGLRQYLLEQRRDDFLRQFCRKLLGYALGRSVQLSDKPLIDDMLAELKSNGYRVSTAVEKIILSRQFRQIRGREFVSSQ
jgi:Protein of unknown function (DUF1592)/Protein of unknown function (DUF1588)/Protein of unknown function (DUF1587)/Protein of unknown function (DUF1585)/Protein of unknown function (DUF1595)/Planctomycete cytochrome C